MSTNEQLPALPEPSQASPDPHAEGREWFSDKPKHVADRAYRMADAMLKEREKRQ